MVPIQCIDSLLSHDKPWFLEGVKSIQGMRVIHSKHILKGDDGYASAHQNNTRALSFLALYRFIVLVVTLGRS
jgi:hypothetical protein